MQYSVSITQYGPSRYLPMQFSSLRQFVFSRPWQQQAATERAACVHICWISFAYTAIVCHRKQRGGARIPHLHPSILLLKISLSFAFISYDSRHSGQYYTALFYIRSIDYSPLRIRKQQQQRPLLYSIFIISSAVEKLIELHGRFGYTKVSRAFVGCSFDSITYAGSLKCPYFALLAVYAFFYRDLPILLQLNFTRWLPVAYKSF